MEKRKVKPIKEATREDEKLLKSVTHNYADKVQVRNTTYNVRWMHPATCDRITCLTQKDGNDNKIIAQGAALIVLGGFWKTHLFYWLLWRWFYYIKQYSAAELTPILNTAQKKTASEVMAAYLNAMMLLHALSDAKKQMTKQEAEHILRGLRSDKDGK